MTEHDVEAKLCWRINELGGLCLKWVSPGASGVPDRIILLPGGRVIFAELKRPKGGSVAARQRWWADKLIGLGFETYIIKDETDIRKLIKRIQEDKKDADK